jgi:hypothetical protein
MFLFCRFLLLTIFVRNTWQYYHLNLSSLLLPAAMKLTDNIFKDYRQQN